MAVRLTKIYTRTGDDGFTSLIGGERVSKASMRIEAYGNVDELNAIIGLARSWIDQRAADEPDYKTLHLTVMRVQNELFDLGCDLATPVEKRSQDRPTVDAEMVTRMEQEIDRINQQLEPLESFVLPGGGMLAGYLHHARTVCRRCERIAVHLGEIEPVGEWVVRYLNRLSDLLFVLSRQASRVEGHGEYLWQYRAS